MQLLIQLRSRIQEGITMKVNRNKICSVERYHDIIIMRMHSWATSVTSVASSSWSEQRAQDFILYPFSAACPSTLKSPHISITVRWTTEGCWWHPWGQSCSYRGQNKLSPVERNKRLLEYLTILKWLLVFGENVAHMMGQEAAVVARDFLKTSRLATTSW